MTHLKDSEALLIVATLIILTLFSLYSSFKNFTGLKSSNMRYLCNRHIVGNKVNSTRTGQSRCEVCRKWGTE